MREKKNGERKRKREKKKEEEKREREKKEGRIAKREREKKEGLRGQNRIRIFYKKLTYRKERKNYSVKITIIN